MKKKDKAYFLGFGAFILFMAVAKYLSPYPPNEVDMANRFGTFSLSHLLGTDYMGRDMLSRILYGASTTVITSLIILFLSVLLGLVLGLLAGYIGGKFDWFVMRLVDTCMIFPDYIIAIVLSGVLGAGSVNMIIAIVVTKWFGYARLVRSIVLEEKGKEFVAIAKINGLNAPKILYKHILPYVMGSVVALGVVDVGKIILMIASLSYLGLGVQPPDPEWGAMLNEGRTYFTTHAQLMIVPGMAIFLSVFTVNFFGNRITDYFDVYQKAGE